MNRVASAEPSLSILAQHLLRQPSEDDFRRAPALVGRHSHLSTPEALAGDETQQVLEELVEQLGQPSQYGGGAGGVDVRWRTESHTVILDVRGDGRSHLSVQRTAALERSEHEAFLRHGNRRLHGEASGLPYLWRYHQSGTFPLPPTTPVAQGWTPLQSALEALLRSWAQHLEGLAGEDDAGFTIDHGDGEVILMVSPRDEVAVFADSRDGTDRDAEQRNAMNARGWHSFIPVLSWWEAHFDRTSTGAAAAAQLVVNELRARGVRTPSDLRLVRATLGTRSGSLVIPGAGIAVDTEHSH